MTTASDNAIHPDAQRFMAQRASATTTEIEASHCVALSEPAAVTSVIRDALRAVEIDTITS